ncbi:MAG: UDP-N-acetylglucosamine--N-acetylmuramyl-(pentapeptide) pyrophosphoryl-undecaprenol N-acetylglucosamine transferase [Candidatus Taylorbacteria bacterium]|nr:UDP-N-acetylglucosamine--N-acetylmuramyl-(pentapeptide) pyrophosphoryl-undecaprenol N-acetylglucosamine transferase [Candidatus Taylorbacteria bacterium]
MKILFTGGGSGGHFYPIIAIAEAVRSFAKEERLITPQLFFMAPEPYDEGLLFENEITFIRVSTGKLRRYASVKNIVDIFKTGWGVLKALVIMFRIYPDVVVGKGGFGSFPALFAARFWKIPTIIHESDTVPGRVNKWGGKFASRIAVSFAQAGAFFPQGKVAHTGNPMRRHILVPEKTPARSDFSLSDDTKVVFVIGGSLGSETINEALLQALPVLLNDYEIIHQTGRENLADMSARAKVLLQNHPFKQRYHPFGYLSTEQVSSAGRLSDLVISRAGSTIFEIAVWGKPSILIPIADSNGNHQRENAYVYAETGATDVLEESNLTVNILRDQIQRVLGNAERAAQMSDRALHFAKTDAAEVIGREILEIALKHEK